MAAWPTTDRSTEPTAARSQGTLDQEEPNTEEARNPRRHALKERLTRRSRIQKEIAFYDALAENESARTAMGEPALRVIALELVKSIRSNVTVDWMHREPSRARIRVLVKRILRRYGYPPDLQDAAIQTVLQQAEALSAARAA